MSLFCLFFILCAISCSKEEPRPENCIDIDYNQVFLAESNTLFCLPDGNEIYIKELLNEFCPCDVVCVWPGEVATEMELLIDGNEINYVFRSSEVDLPSGQLPNDLQFILHEVELVNDCSENDPSPDVKHVQLELR